MKDVKLNIWNHGSAENPEAPCGEVCIFKVSGVDIPISFIESITDKQSELAQEDLATCLGVMPTEIEIKVSIKNIEYIDDGWYFEVDSFEEVIQPPINE